MDFWGLFPWKNSREKSTPKSTEKFKSELWSFGQNPHCNLAHQNRTIAIASDFRVDGAKSPEIAQKEGVSGSEIAARNRRSLATFHRTLKSQCIIAVSCLGNRAISGVRDGHRNRRSQKSLRFRCAKHCKDLALKISGREGHFTELCAKTKLFALY